ISRWFRIVMAGLVPAIHVFTHGTKNADARDKPGHDGVCECKFGRPAPGEVEATAFRAIPCLWYGRAPSKNQSILVTYQPGAPSTCHEAAPEFRWFLTICAAAAGRA